MIAYSTLACPSWTVEEAAAACQRYGYEAIEWRLADGELLSAATPKGMLDRIVASAADVPAVCIDASTRLVEPDEAQREAGIADVTALAALAERAGAPWVRVFGGHIPEGMDRATALRVGAETLRACAGAARSHGVGVVVETHDEWRGGADVGELIEAAGDADVAALWDVQHTLSVGEPPEETIRILDGGALIGHVHLKDAVPSAGGWEPCLPGAGEVPMRSIADLLAEAGYRGALSFEWEKKWRPALEDPEFALPEFVRVLRGG